MKSRISIIIAAFAVIISFAFITVNKETRSAETTTVNAPATEPMSAYAMEDENQWD